MSLHFWKIHKKTGLSPILFLKNNTFPFVSYFLWKKTRVLWKDLETSCLRGHVSLNVYKYMWNTGRYTYIQMYIEPASQLFTLHDFISVDMTSTCFCQISLQRSAVQTIRCHWCRGTSFRHEKEKSNKVYVRITLKLLQQMPTYFITKNWSKEVAWWWGIKRQIPFIMVK